MHPDLAALLDADDEAQHLVADAERLVRERIRMAREERDAGQVRAQDATAAEVERLVRGIEADTSRRAAERAEERDRRRRARAAAAERAFAAAIEVYLNIVGGRAGPEREP